MEFQKKYMKSCDQFGMKKIHIWLVKCTKCGYEFEHIFHASDILRPHMFNELRFKCIKCGKSAFDPVRSLGTYDRDEFIREHPDIDINSIQDFSNDPSAEA